MWWVLLNLEFKICKMFKFGVNAWICAENILTKHFIMLLSRSQITRHKFFFTKIVFGIFAFDTGGRQEACAAKGPSCCQGAAKYVNVWQKYYKRYLNWWCHLEEFSSLRVSLEAGRYFNRTYNNRKQAENWWSLPLRLWPDDGLPVFLCQ